MRRAAGERRARSCSCCCAPRRSGRASLYVPGIAFLLLGVGLRVWVALAAARRAARARARPGDGRGGARRGRCGSSSRPGLVPPPGGELVEPLLRAAAPAQMPTGRDGKRRVRVDVRFGRRGRRVLEPRRLVIRDPLGLAAARDRAAEATGRGPRAAADRAGRCRSRAAARPGPVAAARAATAAARRARRRPRWSSTCCGRTARARPPRASTGRRSRAPGADGAPLRRRPDARGRSSSSTRATRRASASSTRPSARRRRCAYHLARAGGCGVLLPGDRRATTSAPDLRGFAERARAAGAARARDGVPGAVAAPGAAADGLGHRLARDPALPARLGARLGRRSAPAGGRRARRVPRRAAASASAWPPSGRKPRERRSRHRRRARLRPLPRAPARRSRAAVAPGLVGRAAAARCAARSSRSRSSPPRTGPRSSSRTGRGARSSRRCRHAPAASLIALSGRLPRAAAASPLRIVLLIVAALIAADRDRHPLQAADAGGTGTRSATASTGGLSSVGSVTEWPYGGPERLAAAARRCSAIPLVLVIARRVRVLAARRGTRAGYARLRAGRCSSRSTASPSPRARSTTRRCAASALLVLPGRLAVAAAPAAARRGRRARGDRDRRLLAALPLTPRLARASRGSTTATGRGRSHKEKTIGFDWRHTLRPARLAAQGHDAAADQVEASRTTGRRETLDRFDGVRLDARAPLARREPTFANSRSPHEPEVERARSTCTVRGLRSDAGRSAPARRSTSTGCRVTRSSSANGTCALQRPARVGRQLHRHAATRPTRPPSRCAPRRRRAPLLGRYTTLTPRRSRAASSRRVLHVPLRRRARHRRSRRGHERAARARATRASTSWPQRSPAAPRPTTTSSAASAPGSSATTATREQRRRSASYPLEAFLFQDKNGYCQHFSGAVALMLRMLGIPARVASGFAPGTLDTKTQGVRRARPRCALLDRGLVPGHRLGAVRPDAGARARPRRRPARSRRSARSRAPRAATEGQAHRQAARAAPGGRRGRRRRRGPRRGRRGAGSPAVRASRCSRSPRWSSASCACARAPARRAAAVRRTPRSTTWSRLLARLGLEHRARTDAARAGARGSSALGGPGGRALRARCASRASAPPGEPAPDRAERRQLRQRARAAVEQACSHGCTWPCPTTADRACLDGVRALAVPVDTRRRSTGPGRDCGSNLLSGVARRARRARARRGADRHRRDRHRRHHARGRPRRRRSRRRRPRTSRRRRGAHRRRHLQARGPGVVFVQRRVDHADALAVRLPARAGAARHRLRLRARQGRLHPHERARRRGRARGRRSASRRSSDLVDAKVVGRDLSTDLAVLKVDPGDAEARAAAARRLEPSCASATR